MSPANFFVTCFHHALSIRFDFLVVPLVHPRYKRDFSGLTPKRPGPLTRSDKVVKVSEWTTLIVAKPSSWIDLDSESEMVRRNSEKVMWKTCCELDY